MFMPTNADNDRALTEEEIRTAIHFILNYPDSLWRQLPIERIEQYNQDLRRLGQRLDEILAEV